MSDSLLHYRVMEIEHFVANPISVPRVRLPAACDSRIPSRTRHEPDFKRDCSATIRGTVFASYPSLTSVERKEILSCPRVLITKPSAGGALSPALNAVPAVSLHFRVTWRRTINSRDHDRPLIPRAPWLNRPTFDVSCRRCEPHPTDLDYLSLIDSVNCSAKIPAFSYAIFYILYRATLERERDDFKDRRESNNNARMH